MKPIIFFCGLLLLVSCTSKKASDDFTERMNKEHQNDTPTATPITESTDETPIETQEVPYGMYKGKPLIGFLASPKDATKDTPSVVVIHEWWGLNDNIRAMAKKLAMAGFHALAVDMYRGNVASTSEEARTFMSEAMQDTEASKSNLTAAYTYLKTELTSPKVGSIGWCFGGGMSLNLALAKPTELDATVIYYGRLITDEASLKPLSMPILGIFGSEDRGIPISSVEAFEQSLKNLGKNASIHIYQGANHAFANPSGQNYVPEAAEDAWQKTIDFFNQYLR